MSEDKSVVKAVEAPPLAPLNIPSKLAPTPAGPPKYAVKVKNAKGEEVVLGDPRATRALVALMDTEAVNGGAACHWGGPAAFAEIMAAIHGLMFATKGRPWHEAFNFVNDAGHTENGIYALRSNYGFDGMTFEDLKWFRSIRSKLTGHGESHLNPQGVLLSNGPLGSALPQSQGLAMADKVRKNDRVTICTVSDGASMEGEAKEAFAAIPGLAAKGKLNPYLLVISDNDTKLSGRITADAFSMEPTFSAMNDLGWNVIKIQDGHDLQTVYLAVESGLAQARANPRAPVCLWVKTIKGYGVRATMESASGGHGFPLANGEKTIDFVNEIYFGGEVPAELAGWAKALRRGWEEKEAAKKAKAVAAPAAAAPAVKKEKIQAGLARGAVRAAQEGLPVYSLSADLAGSTGMSFFQKSFPDRFVEVGVAEANMISAGAGFSKAGFIPIVDTFGQFGVTKGNLPLTMSALSQAPVIAVFSHVGFQDAADGASHEATTYFAATSPIPHTVVIACSCADEAEALMYQAIKRMAQARLEGKDGESVIFFVGRENYPVHLLDNPNYAWDKAQVLASGNDVVIAASGPLVGRAIDAGRLLKEKGVAATVISNPFINQVDVETIGAAVKKCSGRIVTIEDHQIICGMGAQISHALARAGINHHMRSLGINGEFGQSAWVAEQLYEKHGLTAAGIVAAAQGLIKEA
ncbi:MAG TPA: transketolase C-terminal domain-containing protein [Verrucomicrobiae bacterium]|jgi:transketolase|nr:transketolase C-terminal domain-containing protein [Verrucomicrobiae bacterium]